MFGRLVRSDSTRNVHDKMRRRCQAHDFASQGDGEDFGAVEPGRAVEHAVYAVLSVGGRRGVVEWRRRERTVRDDKEIDAEDGEAFSDAIVCVLEQTLHDRGVDFDDDDAAEASEHHSVVVG